MSELEPCPWEKPNEKHRLYIVGDGKGKSGGTSIGCTTCYYEHDRIVNVFARRLKHNNTRKAAIKMWNDRTAPRTYRGEDGNGLALIWSGEWKAYWRPLAHGYTDDVTRAGIFTMQDAKTRTYHCDPSKQIVIVPLFGPLPDTEDSDE